MTGVIMENNNFVRITMASMDDDGPDESCLVKILCMIDCKAMIVGGEWFGKVINDGATYPFVLTSSGALDYGHDEEGVRQVEHITITNKEIVENEYVTVSGVDNGEPFESVFKITEIHKYLSV
jgi:hypothetical protein